MEEANEFYGEIEEIVDQVEKRFKRTKNFKLLHYPPFDHHFLPYDENTKNSGFDTSFRHRIEKERLLLQEELPGSIVVRTYEERIDLMRAVIVGPPGSPYVHGLFFFDILVPRNYPDCPPRLHYRSYNLDLNPYLDPKGKVSLSLLETYSTGSCVKDQEKWNPQNSTILQVLIAIQTSVLGANLYPSGRQVIENPEWLKYKKAVTLTCTGMLCMLRDPPINFLDFVEGYFRTRAHYILLNYRKQMDGSDLMLQLFLQLYRAFEQKGTYCKHHLSGLLPGEDNITNNMHLTEEKSSIKGFIKNVFTILSDLLN